jgi:hypothetical protein
MLLIIPSIHIRGGKCSPSLDYNDSHHLPGYEAPSERTRLLRMENAKSIHLFFDVSEAYTDENLELIRQIRTAVDLPLGLTLPSMPSVENIKKLFSNGIYRISFRSYENSVLLQEVMAAFPSQQLAFYFEENGQASEILHKLKSLGACRVFIDPTSLNDETAASLEALVAPHKLRLSAITRVLQYEDFSRIRSIAPSLDSLILDGVLEHDSFPCQKLWRIDEERAYNARGGEANLWRNPLEGTPHI